LVAESGATPTPKQPIWIPLSRTCSPANTKARSNECRKASAGVHEIKFEGYRVHLHIANENVRVFTRRGNDWTKRFRKIAHDAFLISASSAIIDGEVVVPAADGTTDFSVLQNELKGKSDKIAMVAFDLLYLNGYDLRKLPLLEPKALLKNLIAKTAVQFSESFEVDGPETFKHACGVGLEGVVSKVRDSRYNSGRGNDWVKKTCAQRETLTIAGFAMKENKFDGLYLDLGRRKGEELMYAGKVDQGFDGASPKDLQNRLKPLVRKTQPYAKRIAHRGIWVEPSVLAEIEYRAKSAAGKVRHPFFKGIREDPDGQGAFDRWWEWVEKPAGNPLTITAYLHDAVMQLLPEQRLNRVRVNEAVRLADPDAQR
jgi:bifunctional non-homologous end joining protein LigD